MHPELRSGPEGRLPAENARLLGEKGCLPARKTRLLGAKGRLPARHAPGTTGRTPSRCGP